MTGLPNRTLFHDRLSQAVHAAGLDGAKVAVVLLDLERFRQVNETLGRRTGDELLKQVAQRLSEALQEACSLARIGGDCFAVAINVREEATIAHIVEQSILKNISRPLTAADVELRVQAKLGIALYPDDGKDPDTLIMHAGGDRPDSRCRPLGNGKSRCRLLGDVGQGFASAPNRGQRVSDATPTKRIH